jgi:UDP-N-acetylglucosamine:LPS N-acetylglucosamine transferase
VAEVAAARRPFVCLPQPRPFDEQHHQATALRRAGLAEVRERWPAPGEWPPLLAAAEAAPPERWDALHDGDGARRLAALVREVVA